MRSLFLLPLLLAALDLAVRPGTEETFTATVSGKAGEIGPGPFRGTLSLNGSAASVPVSGRSASAGASWRLPLTLRYADVPADWADRFQPATLQYDLRGGVPGHPPVAWSGTRRWDAIAVEGDRDAVSRFVSLRTLEVVELSLLESEARALVAVRNPFAFPLKVASSRYRLWANDREVGAGDTRGMLLRASQVNILSLPISLDHGALLGAAGRAVVSRGEVAARLRGTLTIRLPRGDVPVPLDLSGALSVRP